MKLNVPRSAPVIAVAAVLLLLASTGGAVAGSLITSKQIKDNTITTKDIKNKTLTARDLSPATVKSLKGAKGATGAAGATGAPGAAGPTGGSGPRGFSSWDTIPSGVTVAGRFYQSNRSGPTATGFAENVNFPGTAPAAPAGFGFGPDAEAFTTNDPACTGTYEAPTAPAGRVCVYLGGADGIDNAGISTWAGVEQRTHAFYIWFTQSAADSPYEVWGNWAYTAP